MKIFILYIVIDKNKNIAMDKECASAKSKKNQQLYMKNIKLMDY